MTNLGPTSRAMPGSSIGLGCQHCPLLAICGGVYSDIDCMADCCGKPNGCTTCCPSSNHFAAVAQDAGGLDLRLKNWVLRQDNGNLPLYVPLIQNGYSRRRELKSEFVALTTFDVVKPNEVRRIETRDQLRKRFKLSKTARVILISVGKDNRLENFWKYFKVSEFAERLAALGIEHITAPNFSFPIDSPRTEHLANRMRSLRSAEEFSRVGLSVIPHINCDNETDWLGWEWLLRENKTINKVAMEFQTGMRARHKAEWHLFQLKRLRDRIGRDLHLIAIGARRHIALLEAFGNLTIVDSGPFMKSHNRRRGECLSSGTIIWKLEPRATVDQLLPVNIECARRSVENRLAFLAKRIDEPESGIRVQVQSNPSPSEQFSFNWVPQAIEGATLNAKQLVAVG